MPKLLSYTDIMGIYQDPDFRGFSKEQYANITYSGTHDSTLAALLRAFPPKSETHARNFTHYYNQAREQYQLAMEQDEAVARGEAHNVHDPIFNGPRLKTKAWLQETFPNIQTGHTSEGRTTFLNALEQQLRAAFEQSGFAESDDREQVADWKDFFEYLVGGYRQGSTGAENLARALEYCQTRPTEEAQKDAYQLLFNSLDTARKGYEGRTHKYIGANHPFAKEKARDWSCMPGVDERVIDGCLPWYLEKATPNCAANITKNYDSSPERK